MKDTNVETVIIHTCKQFHTDDKNLYRRLSNVITLGSDHKVVSEVVT